MSAHWRRCCTSTEIPSPRIAGIRPSRWAPDCCTGWQCPRRTEESLCYPEQQLPGCGSWRARSEESAMGVAPVSAATFRPARWTIMTLTSAGFSMATMATMARAPAEASATFSSDLRCRHLPFPLSRCTVPFPGQGWCHFCGFLLHGIGGHPLLHL